MNFIIKTYQNGVVYQKHFLFILNKGLNIGKPQFEPFTNSFVVIFEKKQDRENLNYVAYSLWRSKYRVQHLAGSVIPFLRISDFKHEFSAKAKLIMEEHDANVKYAAALKFLDLKRKQLNENLNLINDLRRSIVYVSVINDFLSKKKAWSNNKLGFKHSEKVTNQNRVYFYLGVNRFNKRVTPKLTTTPIKAKTMVFKTSAEVKFGIIPKPNHQLFQSLKITNYPLRPTDLVELALYFSSIVFCFKALSSTVI